MKLLNSVKGLGIMIFSTKIFHPENVFKGKRVAVIGAADSAFEKENGAYIDSFDIIVRINKAPHAWSPEKAKFIGNRTDVLFHSFYENTESGGGPINFELYKQQGIQFIVNPNINFKGFRTHLNYFKRNLKNNGTYILSPKIYKKMIMNFGKFIPTIGYSAIYTILSSNCKEVYISGFTFFRTPYGNGYRDHMQNMLTTKQHLQQQGMHDPELELQEFINYMKANKIKDKVILDSALENIVNNYKN